MKKQYFIILVIAGLFAFLPACRDTVKYNTLIITGQAQGDWQTSSSILKKLLDQTGMFKTRILVTPEKGSDMSTFSPDFSKYRLVVLDYNGDPWPENTKTAFVDYVISGGGVIICHESGNAFPDWKEYNQMIGVGGGEGRDQSVGPYIYFRRNEMVIDTASRLAGSAVNSQEFEIMTRITDHPVTAGLPARWLHGSDRLSGPLRGPAINLDILATAYSDPVSQGSGRDEPALMVITYGKGRIFHTTLGYPQEGGGPALECAGFITTFQRGAEWAVTGNVIQPLPLDFPSAAAVSLRSGFIEPTLAEVMKNLGSYEINKSTRYFSLLQNYIRQTEGDEKSLLNFEKMMVKVLKAPETTVEAKKLLLRELSWMGSDYCVSAIRSMTGDAELQGEAEFALARLQANK
jgi:type 1 glutamine amidotransferase